MRLARFGVDGFLLAMLLAIAAAALAPELGASRGRLRLDLVTTAGVALVFFLHGAALPLESLARGARRARLHLAVQVTTWLVFPLLGALLFALTRGWLGGGLALGLFYLCAVSSTISSAVALTAVAGGNVPAALFNATLSGVLGVLLTPLLAGMVADTAGVELSIVQAVSAVALKILLPLALGQACRPWLAAALARHRGPSGLADRGVIVLIVYVAFCDAFLAGTWREVGAGHLAAVGLLVVALLAFVLALVRALARRLGLPREDEIALVFCGSQKSLANGMPIARVLFEGHAALGLVVLPMILYHQLQLVAGAVLAQRYARG